MSIGLTYAPRNASGTHTFPLLLGGDEAHVAWNGDSPVRGEVWERNSPLRGVLSCIKIIFPVGVEFALKGFTPYMDISQFLLFLVHRLFSIIQATDHGIL